MTGWRAAGCRHRPQINQGVVPINKPSIDQDYGPNNPEPLAMKDSAMVRDPSRDSLHATLEYIDGARNKAMRQPEQ